MYGKSPENPGFAGPSRGENLGPLWATESLSGMVILLSIYERYGID